MIDLLLLSIGILGVTVSSITDIKTREVPDWICYGMIISGLSLRGIQSLTTLDYMPILYGVLGFTAAFIIANALYYTKQWGGGDSKLLMGIGALFGNGIHIPGLTTQTNIPFLLVFLLNLFILGAAYAIFYALTLAVIHRRTFIQEYKHQNPGKIKFSMIALPLAIFASFFLFKTGLQLIAAAFSVSVVLLFNLVFVLKSVEKVALEKWIPVSKLTEGDWVINTVKVGTKTICSSKDLGLEKNQIELLKKHKIRKVLVKDGIPFVPSFFIALFVTLLWGNLLVYLL